MFFCALMNTRSFALFVSSKANGWHDGIPRGL